MESPTSTPDCTSSATEGNGQNRDEPSPEVSAENRQVIAAEVSEGTLDALTARATAPGAVPISGWPRPMSMPGGSGVSHWPGKTAPTSGARG